MWIVIIAAILLSFLPIVNFVFQLLFDTGVAVTAQTGEKEEEEPKRDASGNYGPGSAFEPITGARAAPPGAGGAAAGDVDDVPFLSPQQRRMRLRRLRRGGAPPTGAIQGLRDGLVGLARRALTLGVPEARARARAGGAGGEVRQKLMTADGDASAPLA